MIFVVSAEQVQTLDANQVVELLRRLIHSELLKHEIPLRSGSVPAQINIADGGEDGRVEWTGGHNQTDWLPSRFSIFQCKRGATSPSSLKKETWTKASQSAGKARALNEALVQAIQQSGAYLIVTTSAVVGTKKDARLKAIREGISEAGHDPRRLTDIDIYDCNKLASWTNQHPAVGLWLNTLLRAVHLGGFQTHDNWSKAPEISKVPYQDSAQPRYQATGSEIRTWKNDDSDIVQAKNLHDIRQLIFAFLGKKGNAVRVVAPSGFGKTRFVHALVNSAPVPDDGLDANQIIYCNYFDVSDRVLNLARDIADSCSRALLIVDDCPPAIHTRLSEIVHRQNSNCIAISIGVESTAQSLRRNLVVQLNRASDEHIIDIAGAVHELAKGRNATFVQDLAQGFPSMAVFAAQALEDKDFELTSVEALISRIVWGERDENALALESLQLLSLFTVVGVEGDAGVELEQIAQFAGQEAHAVFCNLAQFAERGVIHRQGDYAIVQPLPLAMRLANMWLETRPSGTLESLFRTLSEDMKLRMAGRLRWVSWSDKVRTFAQVLINEALPDLASLDTKFGSKLLDRLVHLTPDATMDHLNGLIGDNTIDELKSFKDGRRHVIWALNKLVFRNQTFIPAARLLMRLGAAENETWSNNATGQFKDLYQLHLSGTEADPQTKLVVLDEGLSSKDQRLRAICLAALDRMLEQGHFSRSGGSENIGANEALDDWYPNTYGDIFNYYREALRRLEHIALSEDPDHAKIALNSIGSHLRGLFGIQAILPELQDIIARLLGQYPYWKMPLMGVNQWLYFDREDFPEDYQAQLRAYYVDLLPKTDQELLLVYSSGWAIDIHDPDVTYNRDGDNEFAYCFNKIAEIVERSPNIANFFFPVLDAFALGDFNSDWMAIDKIASHVNNPTELFEHLKTLAPLVAEPQKHASFVGSVIAGARKTDRSQALTCLSEALEEAPLVPYAVNLIASASLDDELMALVIDLLVKDQIDPHSTVAIAFPDTLEGISPQLIVDLLHQLGSRGADGAWASLEFIARMQHGGRFDQTSFIEITRRAVTNGTLFERGNFSSMDWYHWHDIAAKLLIDGHADSVFVDEFLNFILSVTEIEEFNVQLSFDEYAQKILRNLIAVDPGRVWQEFHERLKNADAKGKYRLTSLFEAGSGNPTNAGVLNDIPLQISVAWMLKDKKGRMPFILDWIELFVGEKENLEWSATFIDFTNQHINDLDSLDAVTSRLTFGAWWGSYADKLESEIKRLLDLKELSLNPLVRHWADKTVSRLNNAVVAERRRDANRDASFEK